MLPPARAVGDGVTTSRSLVASPLGVAGTPNARKLASGSPCPVSRLAATEGASVTESFVSRRGQGSPATIHGAERQFTRACPQFTTACRQFIRFSPRPAGHIAPRLRDISRPWTYRVLGHIAREAHIASAGRIASAGYLAREAHIACEAHISRAQRSYPFLQNSKKSNRP